MQLRLAVDSQTNLHHQQLQQLVFSSACSDWHCEALQMEASQESFLVIY